MALGLTLLALTRMTGILEEVTEVDLHSLKRESDIHHASWLVDISLGHAHSTCRAGGPGARVRGDLERAASNLREKVALVTDVDPVLHKMAHRWLALAARVSDDPMCAAVGSEGFRRERDKLDDELTDLWSKRLAEFHARVATKDAQARRIGSKALHFGGMIAVAAGVVAIALSRHLAKSMSLPLARLTLNARRVGAGDLSTKIRVEGPSEMRSLAAEFERMRARLAQVEQLKQGFLASVSHELRTPLSKLREAIALLADGVVGDLSPEQTRVLAIARDACEREIRMVRTLLDLSRLRAGSPLRQRTGRSIDEIVRQAVREELAEMKEQNVIVEVLFDGKPPVCHLDAALIERSLANLVRNAISVSQQGQRVIVRRSECTGSGASRSFRITVSDEGPGVPLDIRETVFNPFVTSAVPRSPKALGVGLGLALAREVALAHGGDLVLDASVQTGATFHLLLPAAAGGALAQEPPERSKTLLGIIQ